MALQPVPFSNRVGCFVTVGGSSSVEADGYVSTGLIDAGAGEDASDVLTDARVTVPIADGVRSFFFRFPHGEYRKADGSQYIVRYSGANQTIASDATGLYHAKQLAPLRGCSHLSTGWGTTYAGLQAQGCAITTYHGCPPPILPSGPGSSLNWPTDILSQSGYITAAEAIDLDWHETLYADELENGVTELAFDLAGAATSPHETSAAMAPMWASAATHTHATMTNGFTNAYARQFCAEANPLRSTSAWLAPYTFCAQHPTFSNRIGGTTYLQPSEMGQLPLVLIRSYTYADWELAMAYAPTYRVRVKWRDMKTVVGSDRMQQLLAAGAASGGGGVPSVPAGVVAGGGIRYGHARQLPGRGRTGARG